MSEYLLVVEQMKAFVADNVETRRVTRALQLEVRDANDANARLITAIERLTTAIGSLTERIDNLESPRTYTNGHAASGG